MSDELFPPRRGAAAALAFVRLVPDVGRRFDRPRPAIRHTLRVTSAAADPRGNRPRHGQVRIVPSAWGWRRDDYEWNAGTGGRHDVTGLRAAAAKAAAALARDPLDAWAGLLPGTMREAMGTRSGLYLADYWALILHHLVWTARLPYPVHAAWVEGGPAVAGPFEFVSELPTDLAEASRDALILFEEAALTAVKGDGADHPSPPPRGLPWFHDGRWQLSVPNRQDRLDIGITPTAAEPTASDPVPAVAAVAPPLAPPSPSPSPEATCPATNDDPAESDDAGDLRLDDQTFTVRHGIASYRFRPRSKQLFALLERIARRPGHRVGYDDLRTNGDVWDGSPVEDTSVRGAVGRLRSVLAAHGMEGLAARIKTGTYRRGGYVVLDVAGASESDL